MDCVFWAIQDSLQHLGVKEISGSWQAFRSIRAMTLPEPTPYYQSSWHSTTDWGTWYGGRSSYVTRPNTFTEGDEKLKEKDYVSYASKFYTHGTVAPFIITVLAALHGLHVRGEYLEHFGQATLIGMAKTDVQKNVARTNPNLFGKEVTKMTLSPAIYLHLDGQIAKHAQFHLNVPTGTGLVVGAYQLYIPEGE